MNITKIRIKKLFNMFDHDIPFNMKEKVTIIHGPNGIGKTIILKFIDAFFKSEYYWIRRLPFQEFLLEFDNKSILTISKETADNSSSKKTGSTDLIISYKRNKSTTGTTFRIKKVDHEQLRLPIRRHFPYLERVSKNEWIDVRTGQVLEIEDILTDYPDEFSRKYNRILREKEPQWLTKLQEQIDVRLIDTHRLYRFPSAAERTRDSEEDDLTPSVLMYSKELADSMKQKLTEYANLSQSLDRTFPSRLMKNKTGKLPDIKIIKQELEKLEENRSKLIEVGLLDKDQEIQDLGKISSNNVNVLSIYIEDNKEKLGVFDQLYNKIELLRNIINSRFLNKKLYIDKKYGFVILDSNDNKLSADELSSGEQHELVLFYELLFKVIPNSLILIDEPEISLHIEWQQQFLKDLLNITGLSGFNVLLATHSPQIIHDRWDLTVQLLGKND